MYSMLFLYIDPGTGSMLFSVAIGMAAAAYFSAKALWIRIKFLFSGKNARSSENRGKSPYAVYSEGNQYWNVFMPVLREFEKRKIRVSYFTSAKDDPAFSGEFAYVSPEYIGEGNKAFARLNFLEADICLMTTPGLDVYQMKRSKGVSHYAHVLHSVDDATSYRLFGLDYFDSVLLSGEYQQKGIRALETKRGIRAKELPVVGCPYLDMLAEKLPLLEKEENHPFTVLVSPSWGPEGILTRCGEQLLDALQKTPWRIIVRPHPQSMKSEKPVLENLQKKYASAANIVWDSGIVFDFAFLFGKPFFYMQKDFSLEMYDAGDLEEIPWKFSVMKEMGRKLTEAMLADIQNIILEESEDRTRAAGRKNAMETAWQFPHDSGKRIVDFMTAKYGETP
jgi:hypothetical protein